MTDSYIRPHISSSQIITSEPRWEYTANAAHKSELGQ